MAMLQGYCLDMLRSNRSLKRAVGIAMDASSKVTGRKGGSEDFYALEVKTWTPELEEHAWELKKDFGLLKRDNVTHGTASVDEFPLESILEVIVRAAVPGVTIKRDVTWPKMWRVHLPDGQASDMVNLTRAKDAARTLSR